MPSPPQCMSLPALCIVLAQIAGLVCGHPRAAAAPHQQPGQEQGQRRDEAARVTARSAHALTTTSTWPITASTTWYRNNNPIVDETVEVYMTTGMVTAYRPAPTTTAAGRGGTVVVETQLSHFTITKTGVLRGGGPAPASTWTENHSNEVTLHLFRAAATDLPADTRLADLPCQRPCLDGDDDDSNNKADAGAGDVGGSAGTAAKYKPDPRCEALGLRTACQGQCKRSSVENGGNSEWECRQIAYGQYDWGSDFVMGRACWGGNGTEYMQLNTPCILGDYRIECVPCRGEVHDYSPANWYGSS